MTVDTFAARGAGGGYQGGRGDAAHVSPVSISFCMLLQSPEFGLKTLTLNPKPCVFLIHPYYPLQSYLAKDK